ncbi:NADPH:quinone oxidoreductase family protein [Blastococcus sp. VKM Ac-2987]|uniref:NADPH:quinone oxidoreductase family protein n=1 Tax=Blastococcus sp. VKM Ac-2987 TaxID=3004141 RepID=UPI0022AB7EC6|nr:NADPH:quinone oxidoreductase family protein [Blastococcus sp. VKM Ac-2987]MCZ2857567.1 NADPH:quinone oxidoreductase family protein [Blastococcus sp. VKM Ac-2987]
MRVLRAQRLGEPGEVLELGEAEPQDPGPGQVRIACEAVGLNFLDVYLCRGGHRHGSPPPLTPGVEVAGRVVGAGAGAEHLEGADVVACPALPDGALADEVVVDADLVVRRPADIDPVVAAALPVAYQTAWWAMERAGVGEGHTVLVTAAAGGVGTAVIQLALARGARVIAAAGGDAKLDLCRRLGAGTTIDYTTEDLRARIAEATSGDGVHAIVDSVGGALTEPLVDSLAFEGFLVAVGRTGGPSSVDPGRLMARNGSLVGLSWGSQYPWTRRDDVRRVYGELFAGVRDGSVAPLIETVGLAEVPGALDAMAARRTVGKIVAVIRDR